MQSYPKTTTAQVNTPARAQIAEQILGPIDWKEPELGFCKCPGEHLHNTRTAPRDCRVIIATPPGISCFHDSCDSAREAVNFQLRSAIGKAEIGRGIDFVPYRDTPEFRAKKREQERRESIQRRAAASLDSILKNFATTAEHMASLSPVALDHYYQDDWRLLLSLFNKEDVLWIGNKYSSGPSFESNFRTVGEWLKETKTPDNFTCPSTFKNNCFSRSNENVIVRRFLVVESDKLTKDESLAIMRWMQQVLPLRAIVDTGGKSLHGWFNYPNETTLAELKLILPLFKCDRQMFTASQPCRLPGAWRADKNKPQQLIYLSPNE